MRERVLQREQVLDRWGDGVPSVIEVYAMPVATVLRPAPSRSTAASTSVSLVLRVTLPLRMEMPLIRAPFIRG